MLTQLNKIEMQNNKNTIHSYLYFDKEIYFIYLFFQNQTNCVGMIWHICVCFFTAVQIAPKQPNHCCETHFKAHNIVLQRYQNKPLFLHHSLFSPRLNEILLFLFLFFSRLEFHLNEFPNNSHKRIQTFFIGWQHCVRIHF